MRSHFPSSETSSPKYPERAAEERFGGPLGVYDLFLSVS